MLNIRFKFDGVGEIQAVAEKQLPFVFAKTLTLVAKQSQENVRKHIRDTFVIRKKSGGFESSIVIKPATKSNLQAEVYTMAVFASLQQTGGIRKPHNGRLAIPSYKNIGDVKSSKRPSDLFEITSKNGKTFLASRKGKSFRILYSLNEKADVPKRFNMIETVVNTVGDQFALQLSRVIKEL